MSEITTRREQAIIGTRIAVAFILAFGLTWVGTANTVGGSWLWASDLCPSATVVCGNLPLGPVIATFAGVGIGVGVTQPLARFTQGETA